MSPMAVIIDILARIAVKRRIRMRETSVFVLKQENLHNFVVTTQFYPFSSNSKFYFQQNTTMEQYQEIENTL